MGNKRKEDWNISVGLKTAQAFELQSCLVIIVHVFPVAIDSHVVHSNTGLEWITNSLGCDFQQCISNNTVVRYRKERTPLCEYYGYHVPRKTEYLFKHLTRCLHKKIVGVWIVNLERGTEKHVGQ